MSAKNVIRQIIRGCGYLPHVGEHPGTGMVIGLSLATGAAGASGGGLVGFVCGSGAGAAVFGPMYLYGAYDRANLSDRIASREASSFKETADV